MTADSFYVFAGQAELVKEEMRRQQAAWAVEKSSNSKTVTPDSFYVFAGQAESAKKEMRRQQAAWDAENSTLQGNLDTKEQQFQDCSKELEQAQVCRKLLANESTLYKTATRLLSTASGAIRAHTNTQLQDCSKWLEQSNVGARLI